MVCCGCLVGCLNCFFVYVGYVVCDYCIVEMIVCIVFVCGFVG